MKVFLNIVILKYFERVLKWLIDIKQTVPGAHFIVISLHVCININ